MTATLDFIIGRSGTGKTHYCLEAIKQQMIKNPLGPALILLLPEHMTYKVERELAAMIPQGKGFFRGYVFGFRRFARQILLENGGLKVPRISDVGRKLLLRRILVRHQQAKDLTVFARAAKQRGFTQSLSDTIKELKSYELSPLVLRQTAEQMTAGSRLATKLSELASLAEEFNNDLAGHANDAEDMMELLAEKLPDAKLMVGAEVWLDGFIFFNPQERRVLNAILQTAAKVHITLPMDGEHLGQQINLNLPENQQETGLFNRAYRTMQDVCSLYQDLTESSAKLQPITLLADNKRTKNSQALAKIEQSLSLVSDTPIAASQGLNIVEAANHRLEIESVAADILCLAREKHYRYRDIGVVIRDADAYDNIVPLVFADYGIPFFMDGKRQGIHHPLAELMRSALEVVNKGWRYETIFRCLRTGFFSLVQEDVDKLENYVREFGIRGRKRWTQEAAWNYHRTYSLDQTEISEQEQAKITLIDGMRRQAMAPLAKLDSDLRQAGNTEAIVVALYDFLTQLEVPLHLDNWTKLAEKEGRLADAAEHRQLWQSVMDLFDQLVEISGDEKVQLNDFEKVFNEGLDAMQIAMIPPGLDYVTVAPFDQNSLDNTRALYIVGANAGIMPRRTSDQGIFTDADRLHIEEALQNLNSNGNQGYSISHGGQERSFGEKFTIYRSFNKATEYLWVSYALADGEGNGLQPSLYVKRLRTLFPQANFTSIPLEILNRHDSLQLAAPRPAISGLANALRNEREGRSMPAFWQDVYNWSLGKPELYRPLNLALQGLFAKASDEQLPPELARAIYLRGKSLHGSVTQFEQFRKCPFAHFARYGLKLEERREYRFTKMDLGQLLHAVIKEYGEIVKQQYQNRWENVEFNERGKICHELIETLAPRLQSEILLSRADYAHFKDRIEKTALSSINHLTAWAKLSEFEPAYFEESFGKATDKVKLSPLKLMNDAYLSFRGQIDRIDVHAENPYYLIIDYKTGTAAINLFEVYYGLKLQLLVYLLVAKELLQQQDSARLPAGMLYAFLKNPVISAEQKLSETELTKKVSSKLCMPGWVLADEKLVQSVVAENGYIKANLNKDKEFDQRTLNNHYVRTQEEFALLLDYVAYILQDTGNEILAGNIAARPYRIKSAKDRTACTNCAFAGVCGFDVDIPGYEFFDVANNDTDEVLEALMAEKVGVEFKSASNAKEETT